MIHQIPHKALFIGLRSAHHWTLQTASGKAAVSIGMLLASRFIDPISKAIVMQI